MHVHACTYMKYDLKNQYRGYELDDYVPQLENDDTFILEMNMGKRVNVR